MTEVTQLLSQLVSINSINPVLEPGAAGEREIADFCAQWLRERGFGIQIIEETPGRPSVVATAKGSGGGRSLMFNGHIDTVTTTGYEGDPLDPMSRNGRLYGRGSDDMKGGVAAMMVAATAAKARGLGGDIVVALVSDEEHASIGTTEILRHFRADAAIVTESTDLDVVAAHKGFATFHVNIHGRNAHGSRYDLGIDAIAKAGRFLVELEVYGNNLLKGEPHPLLGTGSVHASLIKGGEEMATYPSLCRISLERRTIPGETAETVEAELLEILDRIAASDEQFQFSIERDLSRPPFEQDRASTIVEILMSCTEKVMGRPASLRGQAFWSDAALIKEAGIPVIVFGPGGEGAHAAVEWVDLGTAEKLADILEQTAVRFCG